MGSTHEAKITILTFVALLEGKGRKLGAMPNLPPLWSLGRVESVAARITSPVCGGGRRGGRRPPLGPPPLPQKLGVEVWMPLCVLAEVVRTHESLITNWTLKVLLSCACPDMAGKLVTSRKLLGATAPIARERALACVGSQVRLQVAALAVHLGAPRLPAPVALRSLRTPTRAPQLALRREPGRRRGRAVRSGDHLLAHPGQVCQDSRDHEHGGTGRGRGGLLAR